VRPSLDIKELSGFSFVRQGFFSGNCIAGQGILVKRFSGSAIIYHTKMVFNSLRYIGGFGLLADMYFCKAEAVPYG